jgi:hypothetical protein
MRKPGLRQIGMMLWSKTVTQNRQNVSATGRIQTSDSLKGLEEA